MEVPNLTTQEGTKGITHNVRVDHHQKYTKIMTRRARLKVLIGMQVMIQMLVVLYACVFPSTMGPPHLLTAFAVLFGLLFSLSGALALKWYNLDLLKFYRNVAHQGTMFAIAVTASLKLEFEKEQASKGIPLSTSWMGVNAECLGNIAFLFFSSLWLGTIVVFSQAFTTHFLIWDLEKVSNDLKVRGEEDSNREKIGVIVHG